jgi:ankyrin repeat protein
MGKMARGMWRAFDPSIFCRDNCLVIIEKAKIKLTRVWEGEEDSARRNRVPPDNSVNFSNRLFERVSKCAGRRMPQVATSSSGILVVHIRSFLKNGVRMPSKPGAKGIPKTKRVKIDRLYGDFLSGEPGGAASLLDPPFDPIFYTDLSGDHLLHIAAMRGDAETVECLLKAGVDVDRTGQAGCTALHHALSWDRKEVAELLLARGASRDILNDYGLRPGEKILGKR